MRTVNSLIGSPIERLEDLRFLRGRGEYVDDLALLSEEPDCDAARVREVLSGNLCRCTGYIPIVEAVLDARAAYQPTARTRDRSGDRG
jgi:hypothetical protein